MKRHIPNMLTCCNLICGCCAAGAGFHGHYSWAFVMILCGAVFDFFDGMVARLLHVSSPIGKELDSLADCVTFGLAPSAMLFQVLGQTIGLELLEAQTASSDSSMLLSMVSLDTIATCLPYAAFVMAAFSALRLAKFNLDERQSSSFLGLPTPANALFWCSLIVGGAVHYCSVFYLLVLEATCCVLLVCELPLFALKFKTWGWQGNELRWLFLAGCLLAIVLTGWSCFAVITVWYIALSVLSRAHR